MLNGKLLHLQCSLLYQIMIVPVHVICQLTQDVKKLWHLRQVENVAFACRERCAEPLVPGRPGQSHVLLCWIPSRDQQRVPSSFKSFWTQTTPRGWRDHWADCLLIALFSFIYVHNIDDFPQSRGELVSFGARGCVFLSSARRMVLIFSTCTLLSCEIKNRFEAVFTGQTCEIKWINYAINWKEERLRPSLLLLHSISILYCVPGKLYCCFKMLV